MASSHQLKHQVVDQMREERKMIVLKTELNTFNIVIVRIQSDGVTIHFQPILEIILSDSITTDYVVCNTY